MTGKSSSDAGKKGSKGGKKGKGAGPVTVVSLDSGNRFSTVFIPAASKKDKDASKPVGASVLMASASGQSPVGAKFGRDAFAPVLPQTPMLLERNKKAPAQRQPEASGDIQIVQHFNITDAGNVSALKKELKLLEPEFAKLVRRALEKMRSDKARTAHAQ